MKRVGQTVTVSMKDSKGFCESFGFKQIELPSFPVDFGIEDTAYSGTAPVGSSGTDVAAFVSFELSRIKGPDKGISCKLVFDVCEYDGCLLSEFALYQAKDYSTDNREKVSLPQVITSGGQNRIVYDVTDAVNKNPHGENIFFVYYDKWGQWGGYVGFYMPDTSLEITAQTDTEPDFDTATDFSEHDVRRNVGENVEYSVNLRTGRFDCIHTLVSAGSNRTEFCLTAAFNPFFVSESPRRNVLLNCDRFVYKDGDSYIFVDSSYRKHRFEMLSPSLYYDTAHTGLTLSAPTKAMYPRLFRAAI